MFGGSDFRGSERNFTIGQSPKIYGNFLKICIKINMRKFEKNTKFSDFFIFGGTMGK